MQARQDKKHSNETHPAFLRLLLHPQIKVHNVQLTSLGDDFVDYRVWIQQVAVHAQFRDAHITSAEI